MSDLTDAVDSLLSEVPRLYAALGTARQLDGAVDLIGAERRRQLDEEGWTPEHDAAHKGNELAWAAFCYLERAAQSRLPQDDPSIPHVWPWAREEWKPKATRERNLTVAGALIAAEIDRQATAEGRHVGAVKLSPVR